MTTQTLEWTAERNARLYGALSGDDRLHVLAIGHGDETRREYHIAEGNGCTSISTVFWGGSAESMLWVLEKMRAKGWSSLACDESDGWMAVFTRLEPISRAEGHAATLPLAVAVAAEKALL
jgi:hypothetical protein